MVRPPHQRTEGGPPLTPTPASLGFRMPAEWEPHAGTWLTWPRRKCISFPDIFDRIPPVFAAMVRALSEGEGVSINVWDAAMETEVCAILKTHDALNANVEFFHHRAYEPWCRDHGPLFVKNKTARAVINWEYNAWGEKYQPFDLDNDIPTQIAAARGMEIFTPQMVLEGGSIEINGTGALLTTESCLLNPNRNPNLTREQIEQRLSSFLGVSEIIWLCEGIAGDDTDGHIDDLTRFVDEQTVVTAIEENPKDENHAPLQANRQRLRETALRVIELPMPPPIIFQNQRLPASYANFYIGNQVVLLPTFRHANDAHAQAILQDCFPTRTIIPLNATDLIWGLGSFHCLTQQEPA
ncbi:agmatine deiminase family protein [Verrucomicrobia bacterium]|nr:agmatine deiminase family protein [Verrucomicrobiota bacterium]